VISQGDLVDRLARRSLAAWSVAEHVQDVALSDELHTLRRRERRTRLIVSLHQDVPRGRGSARLDLDAFDGSADDLIDQLATLALTSIGPAWPSAPPAAPARVALVDNELIKRELDAVARAILVRLRRPAGLAVTASAEALREKVTVIASSGFRTSWVATALRVDATLAIESAASAADLAGPPGPRPTPPDTTATATTAPIATPGGAPSLAISRVARRLDDLELDDALAGAAADLRHLAAAGPAPAGPCALWLGPDALLHGDELGLWAVFAHQADSAVERQGLTRYRWRSAIAPGATELAEPLSILSDGALDFAALSAPVTDDAVAIRRFPLIDRGVAVGLGLSPREAALRSSDPNGGVRNLIVAPGSWSAGPSATRRTIELRRLRALTIDPYTGDATLDIALGLEHRPDRGEPTPFTGGSIRLDLVSALAGARRSSQPLRRAAYHGPASVLIEDAELLP